MNLTIESTETAEEETLEDENMDEDEEKEDLVSNLENAAARIQAGKSRPWIRTALN